MDIDDLPARELEEIRDFLMRYSREEGHAIDPRGALGAEGAMALVKRCVKHYRKKAA